MDVQPVGEGTNHGNDHEYSPQSINYAGNRGQQFDRNSEQIFDSVGKAPPKRVVLQPRGSHSRIDGQSKEAFAEEHRDRQAEQRADDQSQDRAVHRPENRGQNSEVIPVGVPGGADQKGGAIGVNRRQRHPSDSDYNINDQQDRQPREHMCTVAEQTVADPLAHRRRTRYLCRGCRKERSIPAPF